MFLKTSDFDYVLPPDRIAAFPAARRDMSRLMGLGRHDGVIFHSDFGHIVEHVPRDAVIVLNDTRVIPARLRGQKPTGGNIELLLLRRVAPAPQNDRSRGALAAHASNGEPSERDHVSEDWDALGRNLGTTAVGAKLTLEGGLVAEVRERGRVGAVRVTLIAPAGESVMNALERVGEIPLPPYVEVARKKHPDANQRTVTNVRSAVHLPDRERYQTVYATEPGAVAAPTAGLHFTEDLLARLSSAGHLIVRLTLHVGLGTFRPVKVDDPRDHDMETEWYSIPAATADAVNAARRSGRPVLAVGTTVVRALESAARVGEGIISAGPASTRLMLLPGASFQVVTDLLTNFHLPRSTLLMLVAAFAGRERVLAAYAEAIAKGYRFYSYGDAMLIRGTL